TDKDAVVQIRDTETGKPMGRPLVHAQRMGQERNIVTAARFTHDGRTLLTIQEIGNSDLARQWDVESGKPRGKPVDFGSFGELLPVPGCDTDGKRILINRPGGSVEVWTAEGKSLGQALSTTWDFSGTVRGIAFSPDGCWVAVGRHDPSGRGGMQLWDAKTL